MTITEKIIKTFLLLAGSGTALAALEGNVSDVTVFALEDVVKTNEDILDGVVLEVGHTLIVKDISERPNPLDPQNKIEIYGSGSIKIGDENTTGVLEITGATGISEEVIPSITFTSISVTEENGVTNVLIGPAEENSFTASITNVNLNLKNLKSEVSVTLKDANVSASQIDQMVGSLKLINAAISLVEFSQLQNIYVDRASSFHGGSVSSGVSVAGSNIVEFQSDNKIGVETPLSDLMMISSSQLYGLTLDSDAKLAWDLSYVNVSDKFSEDGGYFYIYMLGLRWDQLDANGRKPIQDAKYLANYFTLFNLFTANGEDLSHRLVIRSASYGDGSQGMQLIVELLPDSGNVPEPSAAMLSLLALAGLATRRRRIR